jgi:putative transcriptional regulator
MKSHLLIAQPLLNDGFFNRSVVYLTDHNEDGSLGFILNFKTHFMLRDVRPQVKHGNFPIYEGGPVGKNQLYFLHNLGHNISDSVKVAEHLYFGGDFNELLHLIDHGKVKHNDIRFFAGYCGWREGQLDRELQQKSWFVQPTTSMTVLTNEAEELWEQELNNQKSSLSIFANIGHDPSLN